MAQGEKTNIMFQSRNIYEPILSPIIPILSRINLFPCTETSFSKIPSIIFYSYLRLGLPRVLFPLYLTLSILKTLPYSSILTTWSVYLDPLDLLTLAILSWKVQTIKFLLVKVSRLLFLIYFESKFSPQNHVIKYP